MTSGKKPESFISQELKKKNLAKTEKPKQAVADTSKQKKKTGQRKK